MKVLTTNADFPKGLLNVETGREIQIERGLTFRYCRRFALGSFSPEFLGLLSSHIRWADVVHLQMVYSFPTIPTLLLCRLLARPAIWTPNGAFQRWEGSTRRRTKVAWNWVCQMVRPRKLVLHVTSSEEALETSERLPGIMSEVIPNGIDIPQGVSHAKRTETLQILFIGRLDPKKGIENLLQACFRLKMGSMIPWQLTIAGDGDPEYARSIEFTISELGLSDQVRLVGWVDGSEKQSLFTAADIVVVPSHTENFGIVVAEALAYAVPVIASTGTPWSRIEDIGCGLWLDNDPVSLREGIERMSQMPLREMGLRGREWMEREFSWSITGKGMISLYESIATSDT